ncbi:MULTISPECIES: hypothetical protein [Vibrio]|uniref:hypothetical protein n=1 Tax=Vibrio TaxID=662 RepID=UPI00058A1642|nr:MULTISPECIES: hypothetical protein [Vibrio]ASF93615.1 hypothetical protein CEA93_16390 [Vibrio anguillarum]MBT2940718.1 hypothetical protein [Vibrio anguillarum]MBT2975813.1 hypothetical protein [Vibrio anguillarum]MBT2981381.1 hypothetical protein [Vibrio anguillarum]MBT3009805.1 hypothetical protein [Vibrio anguillarum]
MRKLANFELQAVTEALEHADFTQEYDFTHLVSCGIDIAHIRRVYRLKLSLRRNPTRTIFDELDSVYSIYSTIESFSQLKLILGYELQDDEQEREDKLLFLMHFLEQHGMRLQTNGIQVPFSVFVNLM